MATETPEHVRDRLDRRRRKLDILRREVHFDGRDVNDIFSLGSDVDADLNEEPDFLHSTIDIPDGKKGKYSSLFINRVSRPSVSISVQKEDVYSHPDLEFWTLWTAITRTILNALDLF